MTVKIDDPEKMTATEHTIATCNSLLRGEISAVEVYEQAIEKFEEEPEIPSLRAIRTEHDNSAKQLEEFVLSLRGLPEVGSGAWGVTTHAIQATANFFGENSALRSLMQGEDIGRGAYLAALDDDNMLPEGKLLIRDRLLPRVNEHLSKLNQLLESLNES